MTQLNYLSTLAFDEEFLDRIRATSSDLEVRQITANSPEDIPDDVWREVDIVHTSAVLPDPTRCPRLKWVQLDTSGVDHCLGTPLWSSDIPITTLGGVSPRPLGEYVTWAVLGSAHQWPQIADVQRTHVWPTPDERWVRMMPRSIVGATVGIVGYGRIGREIGRQLSLLGMKVLGMTSGLDKPPAPGEYFHGRDAGADEAELFAPSGLHEMIARSDYLVVVVPLTDSTRGMIDAAALANLREGSVLINVARGGIVDEDAVRGALSDGRLRCAVLDVFDNEPLAPDDAWWDVPNAIVTPHVAGLSPNYYDQVLQIVGDNVQRLISGAPLMNRVDRTKGY